MMVLAAAGWAHGSAAAGRTRTFEVTAQRFRFDPAVLEVEEGDLVRVTFRSQDVTHGFSIREFGVEMAIPEGGPPVTVEFLARRAGRFTFACSEVCGDGHPDMKGRIFVYPRGRLGEKGALPAEEAAPLRPDPAEPDFAVVNLPTALTLPRGGLAFRVTHRFSRPLTEGDFGDLVADLFGFDAGGDVGLEVRVGLPARTQVGLFRTSGDRTISFFAQHLLFGRDRLIMDVSLVGSVEGIDNFHEEYSPRLGILLARRFGDRAALYALPAWIGNTNILPDGVGLDEDTVVLGLGGRLRLFRGVSLAAEINPRLSGFDGGPNSGMSAAFGIESRVGGHSFQVNFSNDLGTTPAQLARGRRTDDWYIGFNISRKFY